MMQDLATFIAVVRCGSMSKAAQELHLSQPAISQRLRALEEEYGLPLLRRTNRGVEVTPAGDILSRYARRLLNLDKLMQEELNALRQAEPRQIIIAATSAIGGYALPCTVYLFQQKYPTARIQLVIGKRSETLQRLNDGAVDMALVEGPDVSGQVSDLEGWQSQIVSEEDLVLAAPVTGPLAERDSFTLSDLRATPLLVREQGSGTRMIVEQALKSTGLSLSDMNIAMEMSSLDAIKTSVAQGHGVALLSKWCVRVEARIGTIRIVPLTDIRFTSRWTLIYPHNQQRAALHRALLKTLRSPAERGFC
ncbi:MAG TPA: LysR family transcriptional regulator [Symbiobacteriaceae bacterium]|nr:LysR family transcriptional regulator [Symbiobacteriaceae bacterium]